MEMSKITIPLGVSLMLSEMINSLLYKEIKNKDGSFTTVERDIPFGLKYSLVRNKAPLDKDVKLFNDKKMIALAKYGTPTDDATSVKIANKENYEKFGKEIQIIMDTEVTHSVMKLNPLDLKGLTDTINISPDALSILIGYLTDDSDLLDDIYSPVIFNLPEFDDEKESTNEVKKTSQEKNSSNKKANTTITNNSKRKTTTKK